VTAPSSEPLSGSNPAADARSRDSQRSRERDIR
jgi:hypothetical protein